MSFIALSGITGCIYPTTGITSGYAQKFNRDLISNYFKKDIVVDFVPIYMVVWIAGSNIQQFHFLTSSDRDTFYNSLP